MNANIFKSEINLAGLQDISPANHVNIDEKHLNLL